MKKKKIFFFQFADTLLNRLFSSPFFIKIDLKNRKIVIKQKAPIAQSVRASR